MRGLGLLLRVLALLPFLGGLSFAIGGEPLDNGGVYSRKELQALYRDILEAEVNPATAYRVVGVTLRRGPATLGLDEGIVYPLSTASGPIGAIFLGDGTFWYEPPPGIEQDQLLKFSGKQSLDEPFSRLLLLFSDGTAAELEAGAKGTRIRDRARKARKYLKDRRKHHREKLHWNSASRLLRDRVESEQGYFMAEPDTDSYGVLAFRLDPLRDEQVMLARWRHRRRGFVDAWGSFSIEPPPGPRVRVTHYDIDMRLQGGKLTSEVVRARLEPLAEGVRVLRFELHPNMKVLAVETARGEPLFFAREKADAGEWEDKLTVVMPRPVAKGDSVVVRLEGNIVEGFGRGQYGIKVTVGWYPTLGYFRRATYRLALDTDRDHEVFASGVKVEERVDGSRRHTVWEQRRPVALIGFNYGKLPVTKVEADGLPPVTVFGRQAGRNGDGGLEAIGVDVLRSLDFFSRLYGPYPYDAMYVTRIPYNHGQGFPGLLHLSAKGFGVDNGGLSVSSRAHEVAHQWWGHKVGWKSYHDQWLSEGFAAYSGALYAGLGDDELLDELLESWKLDILGKGTMLRRLGMSRFGHTPELMRLSKGSKAGPIWLGSRLMCSVTPLDFQLLVYEKGAWVLHMLRMLMMDHATGSDSAFLAMMRDFVATHGGSNASTEDFRRLVEQHVGEDMGWFFDQWVYGTAIPSYIWAWTTESQGSEHVLRLRVRQRADEGTPFRATVPVRVEFEDQATELLRLNVEHPEQEFEFRLAGKPKRLEFNAGNAVLTRDVSSTRY